MVTGSHTLVQIVYYGKMGVMQYMTPLHDAYAPVKVGREPILQVVFHGKVSAWHKSLMAY